MTVTGMSEVSGFSPTAYVALIKAFTDAGYRLSGFHDFTADKCLILRHDIDFSIPYALEMAKLEQDHGFAATYFILLTSNFYNPLAFTSRQQIGELVDCGARLGLHFDPTAYEDMEAGFEVERRTFEDAFACSLDIVSLHRPRNFLDDNNRKLPVRHTYEDELFKDIKYISDSGGQFAHGHPLYSAEFAQRSTIHLNLHPIWWMRDGSTPSEKLRSWQKDLLGFVNQETGRNCRTFDGQGIIDPGPCP